MNENRLTSLEQGDVATIIGLQGGSELQRRLRSVGIKEGKTVRMVARHLFSGPLVVEVDGKQITIGRRMAHQIIIAHKQ